ncbi:MAG: hypothetical protein LLG16_06990 [Euryarchaeota archaeon]|nr:hypothetical protein [Euryarchaeota archaeon]
MSFNRRYDLSVAAGPSVIIGAVINLPIFVTGAIPSIHGDYSDFIAGMFVLGTIANVCAIWAGVQTIKRKHYDHCVAAYVVITFGPSFFLTAPGLILPTLSRHDLQGII